MALHYAVRHSKLEVLKLFEPRMKDGDINVLNCFDGLTPLQTSMETQVDVEVPEMLCRWGADVNCVSFDELPALHYLMQAAYENFPGSTTEYPQTILEKVLYDMQTILADILFRITWNDFYYLSHGQHLIDPDDGWQTSYFFKKFTSKLHCLQNMNEYLYKKTATNFHSNISNMYSLWLNMTGKFLERGL